VIVVKRLLNYVKKLKDLNVGGLVVWGDDYRTDAFRCGVDDAVHGDQRKMETSTLVASPEPAVSVPG
jgi:hypothetical protein